MKQRLSVRVNPEFVLDAGYWEEIGNSEVIVEPPATAMFSPVLDYLRSKPDPRWTFSGSTTAKALQRIW